MRWVQWKCATVREKKIVLGVCAEKEEKKGRKEGGKGRSGATCVVRERKRDERRKERKRKEDRKKCVQGCAGKMGAIKWLRESKRRRGRREIK